MATRRPNFATAKVTLASEVADDGTFTVDYPSGTSQLSFNAGLAGSAHYMIVNDNDKWEAADPGIAVSFGASEITVTNQTGEALAAETDIRLQFEMKDGDYRIPLTIPLPPLADITAADIVTEIRPGLRGYLEHAEVVVTDPVTTASKAATLNFEIDTTDVTGGTIAMTSANMTPLGATVAAADITDNNRLTEKSKLSVEASSVTAFVEGTAYLVIYIRPDFEDAY